MNDHQWRQLRILIPSIAIGLNILMWIVHVYAEQYIKAFIDILLAAAIAWALNVSLKNRNNRDSKD